MGFVSGSRSRPHHRTSTVIIFPPKWWLGEPLWDTVADKGLKAAAYFWAGSESKPYQVAQDDSETTEAVASIDSMIWRLTDGLRKRGAFEDVTIVMVGDHGIVARCEKPPAGHNNQTETVEQLNKGLDSGEVENRKSLKVYLKEDLPRFYGEAKEGRGTSIGEEHMGAPNCRSKTFPQSILLPAA
ncbi:hypothetical protein WN944_005872 [Citrus x changshan-huyou]|uniref:Uncharacterized protein n=1 Tax=Citrus x changshan-huyou TaxID=2935761 RepID=A0AAP0QWN1_9ROSI